MVLTISPTPSGFILKLNDFVQIQSIRQDYEECTRGFHLSKKLYILVGVRSLGLYSFLKYSNLWRANFSEKQDDADIKTGSLFENVRCHKVTYGKKAIFRKADRTKLNSKKSY